LFGRGQSNIDRLCEDASSRSVSHVVCHSGEEALTDADLVITSITYSANLVPFLDANRLKPGSFAAIADLAVPWKKENFSALDQIAIDDLEQEASLHNKLLPPEFVTGDLSGLVRGEFAGRNQDSDRSAFIFRGHAMGDLALSTRAFQRASKRKD